MTVVWTGRALADLDEIVAYLLEEWTAKEAQNFIDEVTSTLQQLVMTPYMYEGSAKFPYLRKGRIGKHNTLIYQIDQEELILLAFIDNRSDHSY